MSETPNSMWIWKDSSKNILLRRVEFGIWLKHHRKIWNFTRRSRVKFQIFLWCLKAKFQIPLSAEGCLLLTPRHLWNLTSWPRKISNFSVVFEPNSKFHSPQKDVFTITPLSTRNHHSKSVEFDQYLWCLSQILTDFQNLWEFGSNTTDFGQIPQMSWC